MYLQIAAPPISRRMKGQSIHRRQASSAEGNAEGAVIPFFPGRREKLRRLSGGRKRVFPYQSDGRSGACPFSPYSDTSLANISLKEALQSPLFLLLRSSGNLMQEHNGGCVLFEQEEQVKKLRDKAAAMFPAGGRIAAGNENGEKEAWA